MNREQRIAEAKKKLEVLRPSYEKIQEEWKKVERELWLAEKSFDIGEKVKVSEADCRRGCCRTEYEGTVAGMNSNGSFNIRTVEGDERKYVHGSDLTRI